MKKIAALVPATPALLMFSQQFDSISYIGPHTDGLICGQGANNQRLVLNNLNNGFNPEFINYGGKGCFCST